MARPLPQSPPQPFLPEPLPAASPEVRWMKDPYIGYRQKLSPTLGTRLRTPVTGEPHRSLSLQRPSLPPHGRHRLPAPRPRILRARRLEAKSYFLSCSAQFEAGDHAERPTESPHRRPSP